MHELTRKKLSLSDHFVQHYALALYKCIAERDRTRLPFNVLNFFSIYNGLYQFEKDDAVFIYTFIKGIQGEDQELFTPSVVKKLGLYFYQQDLPMDEVFTTTEIEMIWRRLRQDVSFTARRDDLLLRDFYMSLPNVMDTQDIEDGLSDYRFEEAESFLQEIELSWRTSWALNCFFADDDGGDDIYFSNDYRGIIDELDMKEGDFFHVTNSTKGGFSCTTC